MPPTPAAPGTWAVTGQVETSDIGPSGLYVPGVRVTFRLADGTVGSVFVAGSEYTVEKVRAAIADKATTLASVAGLSG